MTEGLLAYSQSFRRSLWNLIIAMVIGLSFSHISLLAQERPDQTPIDFRPRFRSVHFIAAVGFGFSGSMGLDLDVARFDTAGRSAMGLRAGAEGMVSVFGGVGAKYGAFVRWSECWSEVRVDALLGASAQTGRSERLSFEAQAEVRWIFWPRIGGVALRALWRAPEEGVGSTVFAGAGVVVGWDEIR